MWTGLTGRPQLPRSIFTLVLLCLPSCSGARSESESIELSAVGVPPERTVWAVDTLQVRFEVVERFGNSAQTVSFGRISVVAADSAGRLAIADASDCSITVLSADCESRWRFGRCGDGPGELRGVVSMALRRGEVAVQTADHLQRLDTLGSERARIQLRELGLGGAAAVVALDDFIVLLAPGVSGNERDSLRASLLVALNDRTGTVLRKALRVPPISANNPEAAGDFLLMCGGRRNDEPVVAVAQAWALQTVVLNATSFAPRLEPRHSE